MALHLHGHHFREHIHMSLVALYEQLKFWLPVVTVITLMIKGFRSAKSAAQTWANTMLDNHMAHIQASSERAAAAVTELAGYHKEMLDQQRDLVQNMTLMQRDFHEHIQEDQRVQQAIFTALEVVKTQTS
jgi:hypothetical protein